MTENNLEHLPAEVGQVRHWDNDRHDGPWIQAARRAEHGRDSELA
jgi:hypothetical protein